MNNASHLAAAVQSKWHWRHRRTSICHRHRDVCASDPAVTGGGCGATAWGAGGKAKGVLRRQRSCLGMGPAILPLTWRPPADPTGAAVAGLLVIGAVAWYSCWFVGGWWLVLTRRCPVAGRVEGIRRNHRTHAGISLGHDHVSDGACRLGRRRRDEGQQMRNCAHHGVLDLGLTLIHL